MKHICCILIAIWYSVTLSAQERITLLFVGDLMQHDAQIKSARTADGYDYSDCFAEVKKQISEADIAIGNLEVTLGGPPYRGYPAFSAPDEYLHAIQEAGFDLLLTANNHCLDRGRKGLERTISILDSLQIPCVGTYINSKEKEKRYPLLIEKKGFRIALLNYTYGTNGLKPATPNIVNYIDREQISRDISQAKSKRPDAIIACMHWGNEYQRLPNREQRDLANWLLAQGVTHIIGAHPHVIQPIEVLHEGCQQHLVAYSLGNFISNMSAPHTDGGLMLSLTLEKSPLPQLIPPPFINYSYAPEIESLLTPICRLVDCHYSLVWTARPTLTQEKNFRVIPLSDSIPPLTQEARSKLNTFGKNSRLLLQQHNIGISERKK